jgi:hypothetical protein
MLAEDPDFFFSMMRRSRPNLRLQPAPYLGGTLRYSSGTSGWSRVGRALLPYLDQLALSHGALLDGHRPSATETGLAIREIPPGSIAPLNHPTAERFTGFEPVEGWGPSEGPVPEAFLPTFHWGYAPITRFKLKSSAGGPAHFLADLLTYSDNQTVIVEFNGAVICRHTFGRVNQRERLDFPLTLKPGANELCLSYRQSLATAHDPRQLAAIFLRLRVTGTD